MSSSRAQEWLRQAPPTTVVATATCLLLYLVQFAAGKPELSTVTLCPNLVIYQGDFYRIVTSTVFHGSFLHIAMNSMSTWAIGSMLEKRLGTVALLITILWSILLTSAIYIAIAAAGAWIFGYQGLMQQHAVGFSGVLFHLSVLECHLGPQNPRSVLGMFQVTTKQYPWVLLIVLQLFMSNLSFTGHLAGILVGHLQYYQCLTLLLPAESFLRDMDSWAALAVVAKLPSYVRTPTEVATRDHPPPSLMAATSSCCEAIVRWSRYVLETCCVILFGRGAEANANLRLPNTGWSSMTRSNHSDTESLLTMDDNETQGQDV